MSVACIRPDCGGMIADDGYCDTCGTAAAASSALGTAGAPVASSALVEQTQLTRRGTAARTSSTRPRLGSGLVEIPPVPRRDPRSAVLADPRVPEERRHCAACDSPVGRGHDGLPGRTEGFCRQCGHPFSFAPKLGPGDVVAKQYEVVGLLAHGGLGWIYLAQDKNVVDRWVVLKGLLNTGDDDARAVALAERRFLAEVEHPNIVKIYNFVEHQDDGYLVMEFVDGKSLRDLLRERREQNGGASSPLPVAQAIAYIIDILPAIGHLHDLGLLFCDFKPDNVMQSGTSLKLIDLGGVYSVDNPDAAIFGTVGYQAPEIAQTGPTVPSDLYTVARTLMVLCTNFRGYQTTYRTSLPEPSDTPEIAPHDSLCRFLTRATAPNPDDRFQSADEMTAQLLGVLREVVAAQTGVPAPGLSTVFTHELRTANDAPDWRALPALIVASDDPAAGYLATIATGSPEALLHALREAPEQTVEVALRIARTLIEQGQHDDALHVLEQIDANDAWEWRTSWYRALGSFARGNPRDATAHLERVYREVPGELAPKLGLGMAAELQADVGAAARWYDIVARTDPSETSACFGLARCRLATGDRDGALTAYELVPERSSARVDAQIAQVHVLLWDASPDGVERAAELLDRLSIAGERRDQLRAELLEAALGLILANRGAHTDISLTILGLPFEENPIRRSLEQTYRTLARQADDAGSRIQLIDRANEVRPLTLT